MSQEDRQTHQQNSEIIQRKIMQNLKKDGEFYSR